MSFKIAVKSFPSQSQLIYSGGKNLLHVQGIFKCTNIVYKNSFVISDLFPMSSRQKSLVSISKILFKRTNIVYKNSIFFYFRRCVVLTKMFS
jgi:hypothetical protein